MSVRKRTWTTSQGERKEAWIVDYFDQDGDRHIRTFARRRMPMSTTRPSRSTCVRASTPRRARASPWQRPRRAGSSASRQTGCGDTVRRAVDPPAVPPACRPAHRAAYWRDQFGEADARQGRDVSRRPTGEFVATAGEQGADQPQVAAQGRKLRTRGARRVDRRRKRKRKLEVVATFRRPPRSSG